MTGTWANAGNTTLKQPVIEVAAGVTAPQGGQERVAPPCETCCSIGTWRDLLQRRITQNVGCSTNQRVLPHDEHARRLESFPHEALDLESDPSVAPVPLAPPTDDMVHGNGGNHFGLRDGQKETISCNEADLNVFHRRPRGGQPGQVCLCRKRLPEVYTGYFALLLSVPHSVQTPDQQRWPSKRLLFRNPKPKLHRYDGYRTNYSVNMDRSQLLAYLRCGQQKSDRLSVFWEATTRRDRMSN